jgi:signal transduction histidine kinase
MTPRRWSLTPFRTRLALAFGGLFLSSGTALLAFVVVLSRYGTARETGGFSITAEETLSTERMSPTGADPAPSAPGAPDGISLQRIDETVQAVQEAALRQMLLWSGLGLVLMTVLVGLTGRWLAGRALRPVVAVTDTALRISETSLDKRLNLSGPDDELHHLADAFDSMLDRLQRSFDSQRRFVANASHELRTPLAAQRASIEVGLADPLPAHLAETRDDLLTTNREAEQLIASLLLLARSERGLEHTEQVDLAATADAATTGLRRVAEEQGLTLHTRVRDPAQVTGDPVLIRHLIANLVSNALRYNRPDGRVEVTLHGGALTVTNTGQPVAPDLVQDLFEPFRRLGQDRTGTTGHGLGLAIVRSIAQAHGADLSAAPGPDGGLTIAVRFG